jgi:hypothetical protein
MAITVEQANEALKRVVDPNTGKDLVSSRSARNVRATAATSASTSSSVIRPEPDRVDPARRHRCAEVGGCGERQRQRHHEDRRALGAAQPQGDAERQEHHRRRLGQGRGRQEHRGGKPGARAGGRRRPRRRARRRHLRSEPADDARHFRQAVVGRRPHAGADGEPRSAGQFDRPADRCRPADGVARPDGHAGAAAVARADQLEGPRLPGGRHAAGHRRHPADAGAAGAGHRRGDRHDARRTSR